MRSDDDLHHDDNEQELSSTITPLIENVPMIRKKVVAALAASFSAYSLLLLALEAFDLWAFSLSLASATILVILSCVSYEILVRHATGRSASFLSMTLAVLAAALAPTLIFAVVFGVILSKQPPIWSFWYLSLFLVVSCGTYELALFRPKRPGPNSRVPAATTSLPPSPDHTSTYSCDVLDSIAAAHKPSQTTASILKRALAALTFLVLIAAIATAGYLYIELDRTSASLRLTQTQVHTTGQRFADKQLELTRAKSDLSNTRYQLTQERSTTERLQQHISKLEQSAGAVADLERRKADLSADIAQLRVPLILGTETDYFACTGSMEPAITCLDTATWNTSIQQTDVVVGATISFASTACWPYEHADNRHAHRVIAIRTVDGRPEYLTKGDANHEPDCWVPLSTVDGYIIAIQKDVVPENAELRNHVNDAFAQYDTALDAYETMRELYVRLRVRYGCSDDLNINCNPGGNALQQLVPAFNQADHAYRVLEEATRYYNCWYNTAQRSLYPGHIPSPCVNYPVPPSF